MPMEVYFVRHGQTSCTVQRLFCGKCSQTLTEDGLEMAAAAGQQMSEYGIRRVLSSPSPRAVQSARIIADRIGTDPASVPTDPRLLETAFGDWEGRPAAAVADTEAYRRWTTDPVLNSPPGGEGGAAVLSRVLGFLAGVEEAYGPEPLAVVSHKGPIRLAAAHGLGIPLADYRRSVPAPVGSITALQVSDRLSVVAPASVRHLPPSLLGTSDHAA